MSNDRLYLVCTKCKESRLLVKYYPSGSILWKADDLPSWMDLHFAACHGSPMFLDDDPRFEIVTEDRESLIGGHSDALLS